MPKFQDLTEAFWYIRQHPTKYLPEKSLALFVPFWWGYEWKYNSGTADAGIFDLLDGFHQFCKRKYRVPSNRSSESIARLYSANGAAAFDLWFSCLDEFLSTRDENVEERNYYREQRREGDNHIRANERLIEFGDFLKEVLNRPAMYVGETSLTLIVSLISGWFRALEDFICPKASRKRLLENLSCI